MAENKTISLNILLTPSEKERIKALAAFHQCAMGYLVREWIRNAHRMCIDDQPMCIDGRECLAPQTHPRRPARS